MMLVMALALLPGCGRELTPAIGRLREVTVVTDHWPLVESKVRAILQAEVPTPQPEPEFLVRQVGTDRFDAYTRLRTVFLVGLVGDTVVSTVLGPRIDSLAGDGAGLFRVPNAWSTNQQLIVLAARDESSLVRGLDVYSGRIRHTFRQVVLDHVSRVVYRTGPDRAKTGQLAERYAFSLDVPQRWQINEDHANSRFLYLFGHYPDRNVFVYWREGERPLDHGAMTGLRDSLTLAFYDGDRADPELVRFDTVDFLGSACLRLAGVWQNDKEVMGGPFVSYCFNNQGRFFMIDGLVYDPGKKKLDAMLQAEVVMRSFTPR
jgi:hypothetical protein